MSESPVTVKWVAINNATPILRVVREKIGRSLIPGYRWRDPMTGRFVKRKKA